MSASDPALETLLLPFASGQLQWRDDALFLRARHGSLLSTIATGQLICEQSFRPEADELQRMDFNVSPELSAVTNDGHNEMEDRSVHPELVEGCENKNQSGLILRQAQDERSLPRADKTEWTEKKFSLILILPPRQRDEARVLFARAMHLSSEGGVVIAAAGNNEGARSLEADLEKLSGNVQTLSKNKCRVFWSVSHADAINRPLLRDWMQLDHIRPILNGRFISRPGVFAWDHIDTASALLAQHFPSDLKGKAADLGSGFGYLGDELLRKCTGITSLDVYEAEYRALQLSKLNLEQHQSRLPIQYYWHDVTGGLPHKYDAIITNPPFHAQGSMDRPDIGRRFISVAAQSLNPGGQLWLVANRHLPYEEVLSEGFDSVRMIAQQQGYKIIAANRSSAVRHKRQ